MGRNVQTAEDTRSDLLLPDNHYHLVIEIKITADAGPLYEKLLAHFSHDEELNVKNEWFLKNLAPNLRSPEIEKKYRLNYLLHKFSIPDFD